MQNKISNMDQLEQRIRRSSRLKDSSTFRQLLAYASLVKDEDQVYSFMEQNKIGVQEPQFWVAKLNLLKNRCQYTELIKLIKNINRNHELKKHPKYWLILEVQNQLQNYLEKLLRKKVKGKRTAKQYQILNLGNIQKETRKFGKIQVYVDPDCRKQYRLQDLISFVTSRLPEECEVQKNSYIRQVSSKPLSFLGKAKDKIDKISLQLFKNRRRTQTDHKERRTNTRVSIVGRKSNKQQTQCLPTPDFKRKSLNKQNCHKQNMKSLDSLQILKNFHRESKMSSARKRKQSENPQFDVNSQISSVRKQIIRNSPHKSQSFLSSPDADVANDSIFSFAKESNIIWSQHKKQARYSLTRKIKSRSTKQLQKAQVIKDSQKDFAFIADTRSYGQLVAMGQKKKSSKQELDLENAIKEIQMEKYESQTFSQIDSNKQNNMLLCEEDISYGHLQMQRLKQKQNKERKKFETTKKNQECRSFQDLNNESQQQGVDQSSRVIYKQLLQCLDGQPSNNLRLSMSQRDKKKRISRISEERSYSFSETRSRSKTNT